MGLDRCHFHQLGHVTL